MRTWERSGAAQRALDAPGCLRQPTTDLASRRTGWVGGGHATAMPRVAGPAPHRLKTKGDASAYLSVVQADLVRGQYIDPRDGRITVESGAPKLAWPAGKATSDLGQR